jgi:hypothetical protein
MRSKIRCDGKSCKIFESLKELNTPYIDRENMIRDVTAELTFLPKMIEDLAQLDVMMN